MGQMPHVEPLPSQPGPRPPRRAAIVIAAIITVLILILAGLLYYPGLMPSGDDSLNGQPPNGPDDGDIPDWSAPPPSNVMTPSWALDMTQISDMHARGLDGSGIIIGIVDTGIDISHPEFGPDTVIAWKDFVNFVPEPYDDDGHGTAMASIIVANHSLTGAAPGVKLIVAKALGEGGDGQDSNVAAAIDFCLDPNGDGSYGAHIISLSLGGSRHPRFGSASETAARRATDSGVLVVASAGNDGQDDDGDVESPATEESVIAVGAVDSTGTIADFSSIGNNRRKPPQRWTDREDPNKKPECVAPGVGIVVALPGGKYGTVSGTSPAAAFVSGALALSLQENPDYIGLGDLAKVLEIKNALMLTSEKMEGQTTPHDNYYGYGLIQAKNMSDSL